MKTPYSLEHLQQQIAVDLNPKYLFFWGHTPKQKGEVDQSCFSQWFPSAFSVDGHDYATAEQFMMAGKARLFGDDEVLQKILGAADPGKVKALGRQVRGFDQALWERERFDIVVQGNLAKFTQNPQMGEFLRGTNERVLVEASPVDKVWGIGLAKDHNDAANPANWRGLNLLGFALMAVREQLSAPA